MLKKTTNTTFNTYFANQVHEGQHQATTTVEEDGAPVRQHKAEDTADVNTRHLVDIQHPTVEQLLNDRVNKEMDTRHTTQIRGPLRMATTELQRGCATVREDNASHREFDSSRMPYEKLIRDMTQSMSMQAPHVSTCGICQLIEQQRNIMEPNRTLFTYARTDLQRT